MWDIDKNNPLNQYLLFTTKIIMKKTNSLLLLALLSLVTKVYSQENKLPCDSIFKNIKSIIGINKALKYCNDQLTKTEDDCKIRLYNFMGNKYYYNRNIDSSLYCYNTSIALGKKLKKTKILAYTYAQKAAIELASNKKKEAENSLNNAREILEHYPNHFYWKSYYSSKAKLADKNNAYEEAISYIDSTIKLSDKLEKPLDLSSEYHNKGVYYIRLDNYEKAMASLMKALEIKEAKKDFGSMASTLYLIGICNMRVEDYKNASLFYRKAIINSKKSEMKYITLLSYIENGIAHRGLKKNNIALQFLDSAEVIAKNIKDNARLSQIYSEKGTILSKNTRTLKESEKYLKYAYALGKTSSDYLLTISSINSIIEFYLDTKKYEKVKFYLNDLEQTIIKRNITYSKEGLHQYYSQYYENIGKPGLALKHFKKYHKIKDSIANKEVKTKVADLEKKYETQKKELEINNLTIAKEQQELKAQKAEARLNFYFVIAISLLALLVFSFWAYSKLKKQRKELLTTNQIKNRLFSIIAHDLKGMILPFQRSGKILKHHIEKGNYEKTIMLSESLEANSEHLSTVLNNLLDWSLEQLNGYQMNPDYFSVTKELEEIISGYEQQAHFKNININIVSEEDICILFDKGAFHVIFRNLISNALKYTEHGYIEIAFKKQYDNLICTVTDTGVGMTTNQLNSLFNLENEHTTTGTRGEKGSGIGLNLVHRFIEMNNGKIKVSSKIASGTQFEMKIPMIIQPELEMA